MSSIINI